MRAGSFAVVLAIVSIMITLSMEGSDQPLWVWAIGYAIIGLCLAGIFIKTWLDYRRERHHNNVGRADKWEREQQERRYSKQLDAFWQSPFGQMVNKSSFVANDSVRIETTKDGKSTISAALQPPPRTWRDWLMRRADWLANHRMLPVWAWLWLGKRLGYKLKGDVS